MKIFYLLPLVLLFSCQQKAQEQDTTVTAAIENVNVETFNTMISEGQAILIDVRTPREIAIGKIEDALEMDVLNPDFKQKVGQLDKEKTYLVYCKAGGRSARACSQMQELGFKHLVNLEGGYTAWQQQ